MKNTTLLLRGLALMLATPLVVMADGESWRSWYIPTATPPVINLEIRFIEVDEDDYLRVWSAHEDDTGVVTNLNAVLRELNACKNTDLLAASKIATQSGQQAVIKDVAEYIYPTAYNVSEIATTNGAKVTQTVIVEPQNFVMREVGFVLDVTPTFEYQSGYEIIDICLTPSIVDEPEWRDYGNSYLDSRGRERWYRIEQPLFPVYSFATTIQLPSGGTALIGGTASHRVEIKDTRIPILWRISRIFGEKKEIKKNRTRLIFLTATANTSDEDKEIIKIWKAKREAEMKWLREYSEEGAAYQKEVQMKWRMEREERWQ